jgi:hypothetical protein
MKRVFARSCFQAGRIAIVVALLLSCGCDLRSVTGTCPPSAPDGALPLCEASVADAGAEIDKLYCVCQQPNDAGS